MTFVRSPGTRFLLVTWDGGGNLAVMVGIAAALTQRGHTVTLAAPTSARKIAHRLGLGFTAFGAVAPTDPRDRTAYLMDVAEGIGSRDELSGIVAAVGVDTIVVDCNLAWVFADRYADRTAVIVHTALGLYLPAWQRVVDAVNVRRAATRGNALPAAAAGWATADRLLVTSISAFDRSASVEWLRPRYVGPVADPRAAAAAAPVPVRPSDRPLVVVSYSTDALQNDAPRLQRTLDALAELPVTVLASASGVVARGDLRVPANTTVVDFLPMAAVLSDASLLLCHAGHGTTMAALRNGVPLVAVPGIGRDQTPIARRIAGLGLGLALPENAGASEIAAAARSVLTDHRYHDRARAFADDAGPWDGADRAAAELEFLSTSGSRSRLTN